MEEKAFTEQQFHRRCLVDEREVKGEWPDQIEENSGDSDNNSTNLLHRKTSCKRPKNFEVNWLQQQKTTVGSTPVRQEQDTEATLDTRLQKLAS